MTDTNDPSKHSEVRAAPFKHAQSFNSKTPQPVSPETKHVWKFRLRPDDDNAPQDWWFASTAIPLLAATSGPLANVMSIAALVTSWRNDYNPQYPGVDTQSVGYPDPRWCIALNAASLVCGFAGNAFLLFNFTKRVRYIVALPATILLWYFATAIVSSFAFLVESERGCFTVVFRGIRKKKVQEWLSVTAVTSVQYLEICLQFSIYEST